MSYIEKHLIPGESIRYQTRLHWIVMLGHLVIATFFALLGATLLILSWSSGTQSAPSASAMRWAALLCFTLAAIFFGIGPLKRNATEMAVTSKRIIAKTGLADRRTIEILLSKIESVAVEEPALGRLLGYGTVVVRGTGGTPEVFEKIDHPLEFREQVQRQAAGEPGPG